MAANLLFWRQRTSLPYCRMAVGSERSRAPGEPAHSTLSQRHAAQRHRHLRLERPRSRIPVGSFIPATLEIHALASTNAAPTSKPVMHLPVIQGVIKRRILVNFRADPALVQRLLPAPFRPKLHRGHAIVGVCLIRLERMRPLRLPGALGMSSENAAHRIAVEWTDAHGTPVEGVFVPRRDTGSVFTLLAGGRVFPGEHHAARFEIDDRDGRINFAMDSRDGETRVRVVGREVDQLPVDSCFSSLTEASAFFEGGSVGYSVTRDSSRLDGLRLQTLEWQVRPLAVDEVFSSYFSDRSRFPDGTVLFDHALIMRNILHQWHAAGDIRTPLS